MTPDVRCVSVSGDKVPFSARTALAIFSCCALLLHVRHSACKLVVGGGRGEEMEVPGVVQELPWGGLGLHPAYLLLLQLSHPIYLLLLLLLPTCLLGLLLLLLLDPASKYGG